MFSKWASLALLASLVPAALTAPAVRRTDYECKKPAIRKEWRTLSDQKKHQFHRATKCLRTKPSKIDTYGQSQNVWDDFAWVHYTTNRTIHKVANFLPWHRYFLILREQELAECGYKDPIPYWNWVDESTVESFTSSSIFDAEKGFGGTGVLEEGAEVNSTQWCVPDGPYADVELTYPAPHCLNRRQNITETIASNWTSKVVKEISEYPDYINFWNYTERFPHDNVHRAIGGDIRLQSSPNDPLFFLHHAQIDRLWTLWQGRNKTRLEDYGGNTVQNTTVNVAELSDELNMLGFAPTKSVEDYMDTMANGLCYDYE